MADRKTVEAEIIDQISHDRLIAAASQMLELLKSMRESVYEQPIGAWFGAIDLAISAATGG